jgi:hypothetical protein
MIFVVVYLYQTGIIGGDGRQKEGFPDYQQVWRGYCLIFLKK